MYISKYLGFVKAKSDYGKKGTLIVAKQFSETDSNNIEFLMNNKCFILFFREGG